MNTPRATGTLGGQDDSGMWVIQLGEEKYLLNDTARAIWELCDGETTPEEMVDAIALLTGIPEDTARKDVTTTISELSGLGLITTSDPTGMTPK